MLSSGIMSSNNSFNRNRTHDAVAGEKNRKREEEVPARLGPGGKRSKREAAVKVVIIETQFVTTDQFHFKTVVQTLTGRDTAMVPAPTEVAPPPPPAMQRRFEQSTAQLLENSARGELDHALTPLPPTLVSENFDGLFFEPLLEESYEFSAGEIGGVFNF